MYLFFPVLSFLSYTASVVLPHAFPTIGQVTWGAQWNYLKVKANRKMGLSAIGSGMMLSVLGWLQNWVAVVP